MHILNNSTIFSTLEEAVADMNYVIATTRKDVCARVRELN
jgi:tRNA C32,U32 (ribose-2'-O)-methylase TrmJ